TNFDRPLLRRAGTQSRYPFRDASTSKRASSAMLTLSAISTYRKYILTNALMEVRTRYAGTSLGVVWHIIYPLTVVLVLGAVLSGALVSRNPRLGALGAGLSIGCGLLPWLAFSDALSKGTSSLLDHGLYLRKLGIPEEVY